MTHHEPTELQSKRLDRLADRIKQLPEDRQGQLMADLQDNVFTVTEVAEGLDVTTETVRRWIRAGDLEAAKVSKGYRISRPALADFWRSKGGGELFTPERPEPMSPDDWQARIDLAEQCAQQAINDGRTPLEPNDKDYAKFERLLGREARSDERTEFEARFQIAAKSHGGDND